MERGVGWNPRSAPDEQWKLGRTRSLLDGVGAPDRSLRCVLVAGTKGKGSTAAFLARILAVSGITAGLYTQPHLQSYRERIRVDGAAITTEELRRGVAALRDALPELRARHPDAGEPTTFELTTVLALGHFAATGCRVAILEVGLGGRLDATNAVDPEVSAIAPISHDHVAILGPTLAGIAAEKAGIMRRGRPALIGSQPPEVAAALRAAADRIGASYEPVPPLGPEVPIALAGEHQRGNAALAAAIARALPDLPIPEAAIRDGLVTARWPGRFEVVAGRPTFVLDGAHNDASAEAFARTLLGFAAGRPVELIVGIHADKEVERTLGPLRAVAATVIATRSRSPRALPAEALAALCGPGTRIAASVERAVARARAHAGPDTIVAVSGSLAVVGEARDALGLPVVEALW